MAFHGDGNPDKAPINPKGSHKVGTRAGKALPWNLPMQAGMALGDRVLVVVLCAVEMKCPWASPRRPRNPYVS